MKQFKEKPKMGKVKEKSKSAQFPKQAVRMMKEKYIKELDQRPRNADGDSGQQASDQVEHTGRWAADELAGRTVERGRNLAKQKNIVSYEKIQTNPDAVPPGGISTVEGVPGGQPAPEYPTTAPRETHAAQRSPTVPKERPQADHTASPIKDRWAVEHRAAQGQPRHPGKAPTPDNGYSLKQRTVAQGIKTRPAASVRGNPPPVSNAEHLAAPPSRRSQSMSKAKRINERPMPTLRSRGASSVPASLSEDKASQLSKAVSPKVRRSILKSPVKPSMPSTAPAAKAAKTARKQMQRQLFTRTKQAAKGAGNMIRLVAQVVVKAAATVTGAVSAVVGGAVLLVALIIIIVIAAVSNSPFGLFFAQEPNAPDTVSVSQAVGSVNMACNAKLELLQTGDYDSIDIQGATPDWAEVLAIFAVKVAGADVDGMDVATLDADRVDKLTAVFWDMTDFATTVETIPHEDSDPDDDVDDSWTERILHITITPKAADDMRTAYGFTAYQNSALDELLADRAALSSLAGSLDITSADVLEVLRALPDDLSPDRRAVVEKVLSLVGKVNYFWGGKSYVIGWDSRWGTLMKVTSPGNDTSGTYRSFGLDCSGFLDWALRNAGLHSDGHWYIGRNLTAVSQADAQPGDFALYPDASHVGLIVGRNAAGKLLVCHCSSGMNNVVVTEFTAAGFTAVGRQALVPG